MSTTLTRTSRTATARCNPVGVEAVVFSMQATTQTPSAVVAQGSQAPASITVIGTDGKQQTLVVPHSPAEMTQLMDRRRQLSDELNNVTDRRNGLVEQIRTAPN